MNPYLQTFIPVVAFLAEMLGSDSEVVLHDVTSADKSIIAIRNGHISGREIGAPATNLALKVLKSCNYENSDYICNYKGESSSGKILRCSTFFIRDNKHKIVGMLCVNTDESKFVQLKNCVDSILQIPQEHVTDSENTIEKFSKSVEDLASDSIKSILGSSSIPAERMSMDEKMESIKKLNDEGVFMIKGTVSKAALYFKVSEATIYRYLNMIKRKE